METDTRSSDQSGPTREKTEFAKRNPYLEKLVPDAIENAVDAMIPDKFEKVRVRMINSTVLCFHQRSRYLSVCWGDSRVTLCQDVLLLSCCRQKCCKSSFVSHHYL
jgi:serine/threonine protein phosphatase PrpC